MRHSLLLALALLAFLLAPAAAQEEALIQNQPAAAGGESPNKSALTSAAAPFLDTAVMCERIEKFDPIYPAVVFSINTERIVCYNLFDPVSEQTYIFHKWYRRDTLSKRTRLTLKPPRWATFSSILLREGDKGPWRVEITDEKGKILRVLRFSITD